MTTCDSSLAKTVMAPFAPAGTTAAFALVRPSEFSVETRGCGCPAGHTEANPSHPDGTTVMFNEYAATPAGTPHPPAGSGKSRAIPPARMGPPSAPAEFRVSTIRQGDVAM